MADCRNCAFYNAEVDEEHRAGEDVVIIGEEIPDNHFCFAYTPIPDGVYNGAKDCDQYTEREQ